MEFKVGDKVEVKTAEYSQDLFTNMPYEVLGCGKNKVFLHNGYYPVDMFKIAEPSAFQPEYFSALNEKDAEKYIGKVMEFADSTGVRNNKWRKYKFIYLGGKNDFPFITYYEGWSFMRTCPETFQTKMVKKTVEGHLNIYKDGQHKWHSTIDAAEKMRANDFVTCIHISKEYEVEE